MSKGSRPRPFSVPLDTFGNNFDAIFRKKTEPVYEADDAALTDSQIDQVKATAKKPKKEKKNASKSK